MKIFLAEDQPLILSSLKILLENEQDIEVTGTASNGEEAFEKIKGNAPDIVVLDILMPKMDGIETAKKIKAEMPEIPVVLLTTFDNSENIQRAMEAGVEGFLLKDIDPKIFINALHSVNNGLLVFDSSIRSVLNKKSDFMKQSHKKNSYDLTEKDLIIINYIVQGLSNKEISFQESSTEGTIKNRVSSILTKMNLQVRTQIAVTAIKEGLV